MKSIFQINSIVLLLTACAFVAPQKIDVSSGHRTDLYFTGRGAAAGIMMDAYLGSAGVAIGIAIDEGIAKEIGSALRVSNPEFSIVDLVKNNLAKHPQKTINVRNVKSVIIEKYGFQAASDDKVVPVLELQVICKSSPNDTIRYVGSDQLSLSFSQAKTNGRAVEERLRMAVDAAVGERGLCVTE